MKDYPTVSLLFVLLAIVYFFAPWGFITMKNHHLGNLFGTFSKHQTSIHLIDMCKLSIFVGEWFIWVSKFFLVGMSEFWVICFCWLFIDLVCRLGCCDSFLVIFTSRIGLKINLRKKYAVRYKWHLKRWMSFISGGWLKIAQKCVLLLIPSNLPLHVNKSSLIVGFKYFCNAHPFLGMMIQFD